MLADRYARAIYSLAKENNQQDAVFAQMRMFNESFAAHPEIAGFFALQVVRPAQKVEALEPALKGLVGLAPLLKDFLLLLAKKNRLMIFADIVTSYQRISDEANGVTRGVVRSATVLAPEERQRIETLVSKATKKQVILTYKEDTSLLGGLVAEVGSLTFDDSLISHLHRINEQLNRSAH